MTMGRNGMLATLAWAAGCVDAISYIALGHVFTANMTGNTVLLGLSLGQVPGLAASRSFAALFGFALGVALGAVIVGRSQARAEWPREVTWAITVEALILLAFTLAWRWSEADGEPGEGAVYLLILLSALAMGLQSAAIRRLGVVGVATTYITGTLTSCIAGLVEGLQASRGTGRVSSGREPTASVAPNTIRWPAGIALQASVLAVYGLGALASGLAEADRPVVATFLPLVAVAFAAANGWRRVPPDPILP